MRKGVVLAGFVLLIGIVVYLVTLMGGDDSRNRRGAASPSPARTHAGRSASASVPDAAEDEIGFRLAVLAPGGAPANRARAVPDSHVAQPGRLAGTVDQGAAANQKIEALRHGPPSARRSIRGRDARCPGRGSLRRCRRFAT